MLKSASTKTRPTTERDLRRWLGRELGSPVRQDEWDYLEEEGGRVTTALDLNEPEGHLELLEAARKLRAIARATGRRPPKEKAPREVSVSGVLTQQELRRSKALSQYLAKCAAERFRVPEVRSALMSGGVVSPTVAKRMLQTPTFYFVRLQSLVDRGVPLLSHRARTEVVRVETGPLSWREDYEIVAMWGKRKTTYNCSAPFEHGKRTLDALMVPGQPHGYFVFPGGAFDELRRASVALAKHYPWTEREAVWFILTGEAPFVPPVSLECIGLTCDDHRYSRLILRVEPWVSPETVQRLYRLGQTELSGGLENRPLSQRNLELVEFISKEGDSSWRDRMHAWNRSNPKHAYGEIRVFHRDYHRTGRLVAYPRSNGRLWSSARERERAEVGKSSS